MDLQGSIYETWNSNYILIKLWVSMDVIMEQHK